MKKILSTVLTLLFFLPFIHAQEDQDLRNRFKTHLAYYTSTKIAEAKKLVYAVTDGSLLSYNDDDNSISFYSRQTGLSDNAIINIAYNPNVNTLIIVYKNGNIDLLNDEGQVYNISHFMNNTSFNIKDLNNINIYDNIAYLSMQFGVIAVDMAKKEIKDTYRIVNDTVYSVSILNDQIYAATIKGLYKAGLNSNLVDISNWKNSTPALPTMPDTIIRSVVFNDKLCFLTKKKTIAYQDTDGTVKTILTNNNLVDIKVENGKLIVLTKTNTLIYSSFSNHDDRNLGTVNDISSLKEANTFWIASGNTIMKKIKKNTSSGQYEIILPELITDGPRDNNYFYMATQGNKLHAVGGGFEHNRWNRPGKFSTYEDGKWFNFDESKIVYGKEGNYTLRGPKDFTSFAFSPLDPSLFYISTYGNGLIEVKNKETKLYNTDNSELESSITNNPYRYIRISGLAFDKEDNLWMTNVETQYPVKVLKPDGSWAKFSFGSYFSRPQIMDKIYITSKGQKWLNFPYADANDNKQGLLVFQDNDLKEEGSKSVFINTLKNNKGEQIPASSFRCVVEDRKGNVWVGTNNGPVYTPVPANALDEKSTFYFLQVTRENEDGTGYYFLGGEQVNVIAVDGGNRKWIGTESSGVFLVSEDGMETIHNFTTANSPLLSNTVVSLAINQVNGEVFIGTTNGLISFMGEGSEGKESYSEVYAYPNPVRPEYEDKVTITGLMTDSNVKITDINGNLIYQAKSVGGQLVWNCRSHKGSRVATGIYLVIASSPEGSESVVTKIMVVR